MGKSKKISQVELFSNQMAILNLDEHFECLLDIITSTESVEEWNEVVAYLDENKLNKLDVKPYYEYDNSNRSLITAMVCYNEEMVVPLLDCYKSVLGIKTIKPAYNVMTDSLTVIEGMKTDKFSLVLEVEEGFLVNLVNTIKDRMINATTKNKWNNYLKESYSDSEGFWCGIANSLNDLYKNILNGNNSDICVGISLLWHIDNESFDKETFSEKFVDCVQEHSIDIFEEIPAKHITLVEEYIERVVS